MKKNILITVGAWLIILIILFLIFKPKAPDSGSIAVVTENDMDILPLPELGDDLRRYRVAPDSQIVWTGRKIGGFHYGTIDVSQWWFVIDADENAAGKFVVDMNTIAIADMQPDNPMHNQLLTHLRGGFFAVDEYPTTTFDLKQAIPWSRDVYTIVGNLRLKWINKEIRFPAEIQIDDEQVLVTANFFIDRTVWGITEVIEIADRYIELGIDLVFERL